MTCGPQIALDLLRSCLSEHGCGITEKTTMSKTSATPEPEIPTQMATISRPDDSVGVDSSVAVGSALSESQQQYQAIFEASSDGLVITDLDTELVIAANPAFCRMHGYDSMDGMHPSTFIHPNSHHLFVDYFRTVRSRSRVSLYCPGHPQGRQYLRCRSHRPEFPLWRPASNPWCRARCH